ncbi:hypothetical protein BGX34_005917 [Mortierella sp. NVP85]|nr:hypothetical protein BGX34_005917 [Mortierella sp. NVP85]
MVFGGIIRSPRGNLPLQKVLDLANLYLETACKSTDPEVTLVLCHDTEVSLSQAKRDAKNIKDESVHDTVATIYASLGALLDNQGHLDEARAFYKKAEKWCMESANCMPPNAAGTLTANNQGSDAVMVPQNIFPTNVGPPAIDFKPPEPDARLSDTPQLAYCLRLLQVDCDLDDVQSTAARDWLRVTKDEPDEKERLMALATGVIRAFKRDEFKDTKAVTEVVYLTSVLENDDFRYLIKEFYSGIEQSGLLEVHQLEGLAHLIQGARSGSLDADDLVKILGLLSNRLRDTHQQSTNHLYRLTMAVSHVLDAMADTNVRGLNRERMHEPLSSYLNGLKGSSDPYLVYQAAYAYQALLYVPDDETLWQAALRRTGKVFKGLLGLVSAAKGLDLEKFLNGLVSIQQGAAGASRVVGIVNKAFSVVSLAESGQGFFNYLKDGLSFSRKCAWYPALRGADTLIRDGLFVDFKKLVSEAPCRRDAAFQWGVCERLRDVAANSKWDPDTRQGAIAFLGEIYRNDSIWGQHTTVKQWILNIIMQLSTQPGAEMQFAKTLLEELRNNGDDKKQALYRGCRENGPGSHPSKVTLAEIGSPSLLDCVQGRTDVEGNIRQLRRQRLKERGNAVYIQPQAKANLQAADDARFPLLGKVIDFLTSDHKVFLLLGESGAGKSTFSRELEYHLWMAYKKGGAIPLRINLPAIDKPEHDMVAKQLRKVEFTEPQIRELKLHRKFILICDGYDESQQTRNLYTSNRLNHPGEWNAKMLISCRSEYIGSDYRDRFQPADRNHQSEPRLFQEAVIAPFSVDQIQEYIKQYVSMHRPLWNVDEYQKTLGHIRSLKELVTNPFLMSLSLEVLPRMVDPGQDISVTHITRVALYDQFIEHWLERGKKRLGEQNLGPLARASFESLVDEGFTRNGIDYLKRLSAAIYKEQDGQPIVRYSRHKDQGTWKAEFFSREDEKQLLREACPLIRNGSQHRFIHRSLLEYGLSLAVFDPQDWKEQAAPESALSRRGSVSSVLSCDSDPKEESSAIVQQEPDLSSPLAWRSFTKEPSILQFLEERVQQEPLFKQLLLDYIERSKHDKAWSTAASNAITILVRSGMQFNGSDLRGIRIPKADLSNGMFDSAQLQGADLRRADLRGVWLRRADLSNADMSSVRLGEPPYLEHEKEVHRCFYSPDEESIAVAMSHTYVHVYPMSTWEKMRTFGHYAGVGKSIVYSPNGKQLAIGSHLNNLRIWDIETGECRHMLSGHRDNVANVAYSPQGDQIASASWDKTVRLWDVETGNCLHTLTGHTSNVSRVAFSTDGKQIASCESSAVRLWDIATGKCTHSLLGHSGSIETIAYSPQGDQLASIGNNSMMRLWNTTTGDRLLIFTEEIFGSIVYSPKGNQAASFRGSAVRLWSTETGACLHVLNCRGYSVTDVVYSPRGDLVASASDDGTIQLWDSEMGICIRILTGHNQKVMSVAFSPKGDRIVSGSLDGKARLWDVGVRTSRGTSSGHSLRVNMVQCSPKGDQVASCSDDMTVRLWNVETGECQHVLRAHSKAVNCVVYSPGGGQVATCSPDKTVRLWNIETGACIHTFTDHTDQVNKIAYSPHGNQLASCSDDRSVRLWDTRSGKCLRVLNGHTKMVSDVVYSSNGGQVATCSGDRTVRLWNVNTGVCSHTLNGHRGPVSQVVYSPQGDQVSSTSVNNEVILWNTITGACDRTFRDQKYVDSVTYSPDGKQIVSSSSHGFMFLLDTKTGNNLRLLYIPTTNVVFSTSGDLTVFGDSDKSVCLWNAALSQCRAMIQDFQENVKDVAWVETPNANYVFVGCHDGVTGMWQVVVDGDQCQVRLHWKTTNGDLDANNAVIGGVQGLSALNERILKKFGGVGEPGSRPREASGTSGVQTQTSAD